MTTLIAGPAIDYVIAVVTHAFHSRVSLHVRDYRLFIRSLPKLTISGLKVYIILYTAKLGSWLTNLVSLYMVVLTSLIAKLAPPNKVMRGVASIDPSIDATPN